MGRPEGTLFSSGPSSTLDAMLTTSFVQIVALNPAHPLPHMPIRTIMQTSLSCTSFVASAVGWPSEGTTVMILILTSHTTDITSVFTSALSAFDAEFNSTVQSPTDTLCSPHGVTNMGIIVSRWARRTTCRSRSRRPTATPSQWPSAQRRCWPSAVRPPPKKNRRQVV